MTKLEQLQEVIEELSMKYDEQSLFRKVQNLVRMMIVSGLPSAKDYILLMDAEEHLVMDWIRIAFWQHPRILITLSLMLPGGKSCKALLTKKVITSSYTTKSLIGVKKVWKSVLAVKTVARIAKKLR